MNGVVIWLTGLPSSGKSTLAGRLQRRLGEAGHACVQLDGDQMRAALVPRPGYDARSRDDFYATLGRLAGLFAAQGLAVIVSATAHRRAHRDEARRVAPRFVEVFVDVPADACALRDPKGLWTAARSGALRGLPGADVFYEPPKHPEVRARGGLDDRAVDEVLRHVTAG